jgi:predicted pyridoxine 5'-phosphate oxidase superfamily flavin-nucleotide-binding protein
MSSGNARDTLPDAVVEFLAGGRLVFGATIDDDGQPYTMVMNSVVAIDTRTLRFALDHRTHTLTNLRSRPAMMLEVVGDGFVFGVRGTVRILKEKMEHFPVPSALMQLDIESVKSDLPPGVQVSAIDFNWGSLQAFMGPVEPAMFEELRTASAD